MDHNITPDWLPSRMRRSVIAVLVATVVVATIGIFFGAHRYFEQSETRTAANRTALYLRSLNETLRQHQHLPFVLANDPRNLNTLTQKTLDTVTSARLHDIATQAKLEAIYLMDATGRVLATSNANEPHSFMGQNYGFRPYFRDALKGARSDYFAIGATSGRPGYFVAEPVSGAGNTAQGVVAIKLDVSELQQSWESDSETVVAVDENNIVVLASNPGWLYRPIRDLTPELRGAILESRQFGAEPLDPLAWSVQDKTQATVEGSTYLVSSGKSDWRGWTVHYLRPRGAVLRQTLIATALFGSAIALLVGFATYLRSRRIALAYATSERQRLELIEANTQLQTAQSELARSTKMAALGKLAASVTHELVQPIGAFRNHLAAAEISREITSPATAANLGRLVDRMESIARQFRFFVRGREEPKTTVHLGTILDDTVRLLAPEIAAAKIALYRTQFDTPIWLHAHEVQLEQVFTNLLKNAMQAMEYTNDPEIRIGVTAGQASVEIRVADNGPGTAGTSLSELQEPFFSTKASGVGMGLGLAIATEIIKDHGGDLHLGSVPQGAEFIITLPLEWTGGAT